MDGPLDRLLGPGIGKKNNLRLDEVRPAVRLCPPIITQSVSQSASQPVVPWATPAGTGFSVKPERDWDKLLSHLDLSRLNQFGSTSGASVSSASVFLIGWGDDISLH